MLLTISVLLHRLLSGRCSLMSELLSVAAESLITNFVGFGNSGMTGSATIIFGSLARPSESFQRSVSGLPSAAGPARLQSIPSWLRRTSVVALVVIQRVRSGPGVPRARPGLGGAPSASSGGAR